MGVACGYLVCIAYDEFCSHSHDRRWGVVMWLLGDDQSMSLKLPWWEKL